MHLIRVLLVLTGLALCAGVAAQQEGGFLVYQEKGGKLNVWSADCKPGAKPKDAKEKATFSCTFTDNSIKVEACAADKNCAAPRSPTDRPGVLLFERSTIDMIGCCKVYDPTCGCYRTKCPC